MEGGVGNKHTLAHSVPDLEFDLFPINVDHSSTKLHPWREISQVYSLTVQTTKGQEVMALNIQQMALPAYDLPLYIMKCNTPCQHSTCYSSAKYPVRVWED